MVWSDIVCFCMALLGGAVLCKAGRACFCTARTRRVRSRRVGQGRLSGDRKGNMLSGLIWYGKAGVLWSGLVGLCQVVYSLVWPVWVFLN